MKVIKIFIVIFICIGKCMGQDIQLSQFYNASLYLNPAFAGGSNKTRMALHQRVQWPSLDATYVTSMASFDTYFRKYKSGVGMLIVHDNQGSGTLTSTSVALQYSYLIHLNETFAVRTGLELNMVSRSMDFSRFQFTSQLSNTGVKSTNPYDFSDKQRIFYPEVSAGMLLYSDQFWFGFSTHHMNSPNQSMVGGLSRLPIKFTFIAGYKINFKKDEYEGYHEEEDDGFSLTPTFHYKFQGKSDQFDMGLYSMYKKLLAGFWYRGIPIKKYDERIQNNESLITMLGFRVSPTISVTYSYDIVLSSLASARTGGAHEFNITYINTKHLSSKPTKRQPCPTF